MFVYGLTKQDWVNKWALWVLVTGVQSDGESATIIERGEVNDKGEIELIFDASLLKYCSVES